MNSSVIGKIEKAKRYAQERTRMHVQDIEVDFSGENGDHKVHFSDGRWNCNCDFFAGHGTCAHTMALEKVLEGMLPSPAGSQVMQPA